MEPGSAATTNGGGGDDKQKNRPAQAATSPGVVRMGAAEPAAAATGATRQADEKAQYRTAAVPASRPGAVAAAAAEPGAATTASSPRDEKAAYRSQPAQRPGGAAAAASEPMAATAASSGGGVDEKARYRAGAAAPASRPGAVASEPGAATTAAAAGDEKAAYRSQPSSKPGAVAATAVAAEPTAAATANMGGGGDEKSAYRAAPASRPGAAPVAAAGAAEPGAAARTTSATDEKAQYRSTAPASRPGAAAAVAGAGAGVAVAAAASEPGATATTSAPVDEKAAFRAPPASQPGAAPAAMSHADASATVQAVESDLLAKQRAGPNTRSQTPGVVASTNDASDEKNQAMGAKTAAATGLVAGAAVGGGVAAAAVATSGSASNDAAVVQTVEQDLLAKTGPGYPSYPAATSPGVVTADQAAAVATVEQDLLDAKTGPAYPASTPGAAAGHVDETHKLMEAKIRAMEEEQLANRKAMEAPLEEAAPLLTVDPGKSAPPSVEFGYTKAEDGEQDEEGNDLAVAVAVDEEAEMNKLVSAEDFDPMGGRPTYRRPWFIALLTCIVCACLAAIIAGIVVGTRDDDNNDNNAENVPTAAPTLAPSTTDEQVLREWLTDLDIAQSTIDTAPVAFDMAVEWMANRDRFRDRSVPAQDQDWDFSRFILAWFYFGTTSNGTKPWISCNEPDYEMGQNDTCFELEFVSSSPDRKYVNFTTNFTKPANRWLSNTPHCSWPGVTCAPRPFAPGHAFEVCNGAVIQLRFRANGLSGPFPVMWNQLPCIIALVITWDGGLVGPIPDETFNFRSKAITRFWFQNFVVYNMTGLTGTLPDAIWDLPGMREFQLADNGFVGTVPDLTTKFPGLRSFWLHGESFGNNPLPTLGSKPGLTSLRVQRDLLGFTGTIPSSYVFPRMREFWVFENTLSGTLPPNLQAAATLSSLRVHRNRFNGTFPPYNFPNLTALEIRTNQFSGELPESIYNSRGLTAFILEENKFNGTLAGDIGIKLPNLQQMLIQDNLFSGPLPTSISNMNKLVSLWINFNHFNGSFPFEICQLRSKTGLSFIVADCLPYPPQNFCLCCTSCCDSSFRTCQTDNIERANVLFRRRLEDGQAGHLPEDVVHQPVHQPEYRPGGVNHGGKYPREPEDHYYAAHYDRMQENLIKSLMKDWNLTEWADYESDNN